MTEPPKRREARPAGNGCAPQDFIAVDNSDAPEYSADRPNSQGFRPLGTVAAVIVSGLRFRRQVERVHALGPRVTAELLAELGAERSIATIIDRKLAIYADLDPEVIAAAGGDDFWPAPLHEVLR